MNSLPVPVAVAPHFDAAAVKADQAADEREADAEAFSRSLQRSIALHEHVEHLGPLFRCDADTGIANPDAELVRPAGLLADFSAISQMWPPRGVNLIALLSRLTSTCVRRTGSASSVTVSSAGTRSACAAPPRSRAGRVRWPRDDAREPSALLAELDLALPDPRHVQQIVDEAHHVRHLPFEHLARPGGSRRSCRRPAAASRARSASAPADCGVRARGCRGIRPCAGRPGAARRHRRAALRPRVIRSRLRCRAAAGRAIRPHDRPRVEHQRRGPDPAVSARISRLTIGACPRTRRRSPDAARHRSRRRGRCPRAAAFHLVGRGAEQPVKRLVGQADPAVGVEHDQWLTHRLNDRQRIVARLLQSWLASPDRCRPRRSSRRRCDCRRCGTAGPAAPTSGRRDRARPVPRAAPVAITLSMIAPMSSTASENLMCSIDRPTSVGSRLKAFCAAGVSRRMRRSRPTVTIGNSALPMKFDSSSVSASSSRLRLMELLVDGRQLLVGRLQLFLGGLQLLVGALQFLVARQHLFVRRAQFLAGDLLLFDHRLQILLASTPAPAAARPRPGRRRSPGPASYATEPADQAGQSFDSNSTSRQHSLCVGIRTGRIRNVNSTSRRHPTTCSPSRTTGRSSPWPRSSALRSSMNSPCFAMRRMLVVGWPLGASRYCDVRPRNCWISKSSSTSTLGGA